MILLKVTKKQDFTISLEDTHLDKPHGGSQIDPLLQPFKDYSGYSR